MVNYRKIINIKFPEVCNHTAVIMQENIPDLKKHGLNRSIYGERVLKYVTIKWFRIKSHTQRDRNRGLHKANGVNF